MLPPDAYSTYLREIERAPPTARPPAMAPPNPYLEAMAWARTSEGVTFLGIALGLAAAGSILGIAGFAGSFGELAALLAALGYGAFLTAPYATVDRPRLTVKVSLVLALLACFVFIGVPYLAGVPDLYAGPTAFREAERTYVFTTCVAVGIGLSALALPSYPLQDRSGRFLLVAGVAAAVAVQFLLYFLLNAALDAVVAQAPGGYGYPWPSRFQLEWSRLGIANALPAGLLTVAYERLYWQRRRLAFPKVPRVHA